MLTKLTIRKFKRFDSAEIDLASSVVFVGPNNSGKTTALQALALWDAGRQQWLTKRNSGTKKEAAKAVTLGRKDLVYLPLPSSNALWKDLKVREGYREDEKTKTRNIHIDIIVEGLTSAGDVWESGFEFEYTNEEYFFCRPLRLDDSDKPARMPVPVDVLNEIKIAFLPPMSGLLMEEALLQPGRVDVLLGTGRSGEVLRNLCYSVWELQNGAWESVVNHMRQLFGIKLNAPVFVSQTGTIEVDFVSEKNNTQLPLTSAGLGMLQTLHLLVYLYLRPNSILLLDEPDAHLEILRQRQTYQLLTEIARNLNSQVLCASHSEVVLSEAVGRDTVVAFVGKPHVVSGNQGSQVLKALKDYGFENYLQAEQTGWVLYVEGSTDLAILLAWATKLNHPVLSDLSKPFVHYMNTNVPSTARAHFNAVKEANPKLIGVALFDRLEVQPQGDQSGLNDFQWSKREIENYFCNQEVLMAFAKGHTESNTLFDLIDSAESSVRVDAMETAISEVNKAFQTLGRELWSDDAKSSEDVLPAILKLYYEKTKDTRTPRSKAHFYQLIDYQSADNIHADVTAALDLIYKTSKKANPHV